MAINTWAVAVIRYPAGILDCTKKQMMTTCQGCTYQIIKDVIVRLCKRYKDKKTSEISKKRNTKKSQKQHQGKEPKTGQYPRLVADTSHSYR